MLCIQCHKAYGECLLNYPNTRCPKNLAELRRLVKANRLPGRRALLLIADEAIKTVQKVANEARSFHYENTLPWTDEGKRILPVDMFDRYSEKMRELRSKFDQAVHDLVANYDVLVEEARNRLNGMFNQSDYPMDIWNKFSFGTEISPIPCASDFRITLNYEEMEKIKSAIENRVEQAAQMAHADLYKRLYDAVKHVVERLSDTKAIFRDSLIGNLVELCQIIPALNVQDDPVLEQIRKDVESKLAGIDPQTIRDNPEVRQQIAADAQVILDDKGMSGKDDAAAKLAAMGSIFGGE